VRAAFAEIDRGRVRADGSIRYDNVFIRVAGERAVQ
jgi:hypothetical protein